MYTGDGCIAQMTRRCVRLFDGRPQSGYWLNPLPTATDTTDMPSTATDAPTAPHTLAPREAPEKFGSTRLWARLGAGAAGIATFLFLASAFNPAPSTASDAFVPGIVDDSPRRTGSIIDALLSRRHPKRWTNLGMMEGAEYLVLVYGAPEGARYTVCSLQGEVLAPDLAAEEVYRAFPDINIPGMRLDPASDGAPSAPLMLADTPQ